MPASLLPTAEPSPENSVLLVEEYDALAIAIGSALKKFAPDHLPQIARSLAEAETLAAEMEPSLFILDFDPPHAGGIDFFSKLQSRYPDARALVLVAANLREIAAEVGSAGALHFIEKPFDLGGFGASVQALLGPWAATASDRVRATLRDFSLMDVLQLKGSTGATELVRVEAPGGRSGEIHFREGQLCHAETSKSAGAEALEKMLQWKNAHFSEGGLAFEGPQTISRPWKIVVLEAFRKAKEAEKLNQLLERPKAKPVQKKPKPAKKIVVIDDTEMLLIFVEDVLISKNQELDIVTASSGTAGVAEVEKHMPDLVLLDYSLPDINGDEVCRRLLANEKTARVPIVMMSGHVLEMNEAAARYENIVAAIAKPFLSQSLVELVEKTLVEGKVRVLPSPSVRPSPKPVVSRPKVVPVPESALTENGKQPMPVAVPATTPPSTQVAPMVVSTSVASPPDVPLPASDNEVVLGFPLEVTSMQLTPLLKIGSLRAKPSGLAVSLRVRSSLVRGPLPLEIGFELGATQLDARGHIDTMRLVPAKRAIEIPPASAPSFEVGTIEDLPANARHRVQITPSTIAPMTMQLLAHFHLLAVEMEPNLEISALLVKAHQGSVRVTLDSQTSAPEESAATFDYVSVRLDDAARIAELSLTPLD